MQMSQEKFEDIVSIAFGECIAEFCSWIVDNGVIDANTEGSSIIAVAEINGARMMAKKIEEALYDAK